MTSSTASLKVCRSITHKLHDYFVLTEEVLGVLYSKASYPKPMIRKEITILWFELFFELAIDQKFKNSFLNDKEAMPKISRLKDKTVFVDITVEHFFLDVLKFAFWKVVENEMIL